nr:MAG TPA: hypothetical protein [Caudoviricetes sp.]
MYFLIEITLFLVYYDFNNKHITSLSEKLGERRNYEDSKKIRQF